MFSYEVLDCQQHTSRYQVLEECELVTHRHGDCPWGSGGGVSYDNGAKSNTQGRA